MPSFLRISVRFLQSLAHGRKDGGEPEWPPSPFRLLQALVAAAAARWNERINLAYAFPALLWLEQQPHPVIVAAHGAPSESPYLLYIPNNTADLLVPAWKQGDVTKGVKREQKPVRPTHLADEAVHYLYTLPNDLTEFNRHCETLKVATRSITHLGWGIDMVAADADVITEADAAKLPGHRWRVVPTGGVPLRVPRTGTLDDLIRKHKDFLNRLSSDGFKPVPPLSCFDVVRYHSPSVTVLSMPTRPLAAFEIHRTIEDQEKEENAGKSKFRPFHHVRRVATVAGMVRNATATVARRFGWKPEDVQRRIEGHGDGDDGQAKSDDRLLFLPLPSITPVGVSSIRRVLVVGPPGFDLAPLRRRLNGEELIDEDTRQPVAMLSGIASIDRNVMPFLRPARTWSTVTPVILPGYDDPDGLRAKLKKARVTAEEQKNLLARLHARILALIWKAFHQAGWTDDALAGTEVEYRAVGWFRGLELSKNYTLPPLRFPRFHLRVTFPRAVPGPIAIGAGRYRGLGLFARED
jgi:CRISPR-associated protein Csb2